MVRPELEFLIGNLRSDSHFDGLGKSLKLHSSVIPTKVEIRHFRIVMNLLDPGFHRDDDLLGNRPFAILSGFSELFSQWAIFSEKSIL